MEARTARSEGAVVSADVIPLVRPPGRPRGHPKTGGRKPGSRNKRTMEVMEALRPLVPRAKRKLKALMDAQDERVALSAVLGVLSYVFGKPIDRKEIGGPDGAALLPQYTEKETARRLALLLTLPDIRADAEAKATAGSDQGRRATSGRSGDAGVVVSGSPPSPSPTRHGNAGNGANKGGGGPLSDPGASGMTLVQTRKVRGDAGGRTRPL